MFNKKTFLSLCLSLTFVGCAATVELNNKFLRDAKDCLTDKLDRTKVDFRVDGKAGSSDVWLMKAAQFKKLRELMEYAVKGLRVKSDENDPEVKHIVWTDEIGLERGKDFCGVREASLIEKLMMCLKRKKVQDLLSVLKPKLVHAKGDKFTHVAVRADLNKKEFQVVGTKLRLYRNVPQTSQPGNLGGSMFLRGNGPTSNKGDLIGLSYRSVKNGRLNNFIFSDIECD